MGRKEWEKRGIGQACAIFRTNPKKSFKPREIEKLVNQDREDHLKVKKGTGSQWVKRLKNKGIIRKTGKEYILDNDQKALDYLNGEHDKKPKIKGPIPQACEGYQLIQTPEGIRTVERHLKRLIGNVTYPKDLIDSWVTMGILKPKNPKDPGRQAIYENQSFKAVISLKTCKGSFYIKNDSYLQSAEEIFGSAFRKTIENLKASQHSGLVAKDLIGFRHQNGPLAVNVDSGSRTGMVEIEHEGEEQLVDNANQKLLQNSVDATIIEAKIFKSIENIEKRHKTEMRSINTVLNRIVESMNYQTKTTQKTLTEFSNSLEKMNEHLTAIHNALQSKPSELTYKPLGPDEKKDVR